MKKSIIQASAVIKSTFQSPRGIFLTLVLTSLLSYGFGLIENNYAGAIPRLDGTKLSQSQVNELPKAIANKILGDASFRSSLRKRELEITQVTSKTFGNPCEFKFGEVCTREYNPIEGWEVVVRVRKDSWTYHVDKSGKQILLDPKVSTLQTLPKAIADAILSDASSRSGVEIADLKITKTTPKTFGNLCKFHFGEVCTQQYDPVEGWEVIVKVKEQSWTYHVNKSTSQIILDPKVNATEKS
ncbi:hypothetical protein [Nostoc sp. 'Lobaria pulmonaria (5183) cyanobiont']|uniref:hypothetical protein n=1 Tax=Nostoc sp. 'Lobaria pulmonaria (5183) cyanobiont' TaxID=1618022 RepID=UPI000CF3461F|nr:hypothetical protein [Nostoc sp. 'Lobaria pulmonaria (5183) cyanobiont']AVH72760.1 hypothetical protein NLP_4326 [Nostoc sp. 'Lobaria pulmonaria (5183) cyanobiont']